MNPQTKKKVPDLRFPEFEGEWAEKSLGYFLSFKNGINASKEQYGRGVKFINVLDILNNDYITYDKIIGSVDIDEDTFSKNEVSYGDILFQRSSETREEVGLANVYLDQDRKATFGGFVIRGQRIKNYDPVFMNFLLKTAMARKEITSKSGGSTRYNVGQETLRSVAIILPLLPEQQKIADFLTTIDTRIQQLTRKVELLEDYKKGVMQQIFSQALRFTDDQGNDYPEWEEKLLSKVGEIIGGGTPPTSKGHFWEGQIQWFTPTELKTKYVDKSTRTITKDGLKKSSAKILPEGTVLFSSRATVGDVSIALRECSTNQGFQSIVVSDKNSNEFIYYWVSYNKKKFIRRASGSTFKEISKNEMRKIKIYLPSLLEQQKIADFLSAIDQKIEFTRQQRDQMQTYKKGLLQQMFV